MTTPTRSQHHHQYQQQQSPQDPTSTGYLTFHLQSAAGRQSQSQGPADAGRRRAETITTSSAGAATALAAVASSSSLSSASTMASSMLLSRSGTARTVMVTTPVEVPPNVILPRPTMATMMSSVGAGRLSVSPTTTNLDWLMAGSPGPSRQYQHQHHQHHHHSHRVSSVPTVRPQAVEDDQDDMVLG